jgi:formylmethanofuran dehydrogenase subunit E
MSNDLKWLDDYEQEHLATEVQCDECNKYFYTGELVWDDLNFEGIYCKPCLTELYYAEEYEDYEDEQEQA